MFSETLKGVDEDKALRYFGQPDFCIGSESERVQSKGTIDIVKTADRLSKGSYHVRFAHDQHVVAGMAQT